MEDFPEVTEQDFLYSGAKGRIASGTVFLSDATASPRSSHQTLARPVLFVCHGFKAFKDWGFFPYLAKYFANCGYYVVNFNLSHNGCNQLGSEEADLEAFKENRFSFEETDLRNLALDLSERKLPKAALADLSQIHLLGHSRGGSTVIRCADMEGVRSLILLASISRYPQVTPAEEIAWRKDGQMWIENQRTKTRLSLGIGVLDEMVHDRDLIEQRIRELSAPVCIIHGTNDLTVPASAADELHLWAPKSELHLIEGAGHTFEMKHPCTAISSSFEEVLEIAHAFLDHFLDHTIA